MPSPTSQADIMLDLTGLLDAIELTPEIQPSIVEERQELEQSLEELKDTKARQQQLTALRQESTQKLLNAVVRARRAAMRVRAVVKGKIGPHSELLVHFNVAPIRRRPRKPVEKPPEGEPKAPPPTEPVE